jgi:hypothetical protein
MNRAVLEMGSFGNLRLLFERMDRVMQTRELSLVHHTGASASETLARQVVRYPGVQNQSMGGWLSLDRRHSNIAVPFPAGCHRSNLQAAERAAARVAWVCSRFGHNQRRLFKSRYRSKPWSGLERQLAGAPIENRRLRLSMVHASHAMFARSATQFPAQ